MISGFHIIFTFCAFMCICMCMGINAQICFFLFFGSFSLCFHNLQYLHCYVFSPVKFLSDLQGSSHISTLICVICSLLPLGCWLLTLKLHSTMFFAYDVWHVLPCIILFASFSELCSMWSVDCGITYSNAPSNIPI